MAATTSLPLLVALLLVPAAAPLGAAAPPRAMELCSFGINVLGPTGPLLGATDCALECVPGAQVVVQAYGLGFHVEASCGAASASCSPSVIPTDLLPPRQALFCQDGSQGGSDTYEPGVCRVVADLPVAVVYRADCAIAL
jgi:hypothetical protein